MIDYTYPSESEIMDNLLEYEKAIKEEQAKTNPDKKKIMNIMNKQLMDGLFLQIYQ